MNRRFRKRFHGPRPALAQAQPASTAILERFGLKASPADVEGRIRDMEPRIARMNTRGALILSAILTTVLGFLAWELSGSRLALLLVGCALPFIPLVVLAARRGAVRACSRWRNLPWDQAVSFLCEEHGLVHLSRNALAMEWHVKPHDGGVIWKPAWIGGVYYEPGRHRIRVETIKVHGAHSSSWQERYWFRLPGTVEPGLGQAIADVFHMLWTHEGRQPTEAAKAWMAGRL